MSIGLATREPLYITFMPQMPQRWAPSSYAPSCHTSLGVVVNHVDSNSEAMAHVPSRWSYSVLSTVTNGEPRSDGETVIEDAVTVFCTTREGVDQATPAPALS